MYIITCSPINKGPVREGLSYFSKDRIPEGSLVKVPLRGKNISAIVLEVKTLEEEKYALKGASFSLKKINSKSAFFFYFTEIIATAKETANFFYTGIGAVLSNYTPEFVSQNGHGIKIMNRPVNKIGKTNHELLAFQATEEERLLEYKGLIREYFAKGQSVLICFPTVEDLERFRVELTRGIEKYSFVFKGIKTKKELSLVWTSAIKEKHSVLLLGTPQILTIPRKDIGLIIVEKELSRFYKTLKRPFTDARFFAENLAKNYKIPCILSDTSLRIETTFRIEAGEINRISASKMRVTSTAVSSLIDMKKISTNKTSKESGAFEIISKELKQIIEKSQINNERVFLFAIRRGLSPITLCNDCKTIVKCDICESPVILHESKIEPYFLCHHCGKKRPAKETCSSCGSWDLRAFGIGVERIVENLEYNFPNIPRTLISKDTFSTSKAITLGVEKFMKNGGILIGTEVVLPYLHKKIEHSAIISLDSLFALPDFKIHERIFSIIQYIRERSKLTFTLQTRQNDSLVLQSAIRGDYNNFYRYELQNRKDYKLPPFETLIKFSVEGKKEEVIKNVDSVIKNPIINDLEVFPVFAPAKNGKVILTAILRRPKDKNREKELFSYIQTLPPFIKIEVSPESTI
ncbi:MAG: hypothetical protein AAB513_02655 [Patescibacteria group bacterium]